MEVQGGKKNCENKETTKCDAAGERLRPPLLLLSRAGADRGLKVSRSLWDKEFLSC